MLITEDEVRNSLQQHNISINGILHIGAHECEELGLYSNLGVNASNIIWIDGNKEKVAQSQLRGIPNVYYAVISDENDKEVEFKITNNGQSSSILDFGSHSIHHPHVHFIETQIHKTTTLASFYKENTLDITKYNLWNFDIQGAELLALKGAGDAINYVNALYLEVNTEEVYKGCGLISEIDEYLSRYNFKRVITKMTEFGWGDALYIRMTY
jgi:FkbM family methyltransferase